jgi:putative protein kinase ArgK-like GTPase of G3E family
VIQTVAIDGTGVDLLHQQLDRHWAELIAGELGDRRRAHAMTQATLVAQEWVRACADRLPRDAADSASARRSVKRILEEALERWQT